MRLVRVLATLAITGLCVGYGLTESSLSGMA